MSEFKPTPGPWNVQGSIGSNNKAIVSENGQLITVISEGRLFARETKANARLIAVAPVMYQKLRETVEWLERAYEKPLTSEHFQAMKKLHTDLAATLRQVEEG